MGVRPANGFARRFNNLWIVREPEFPGGSVTEADVTSNGAAIPSPLAGQGSLQISIPWTGTRRAERNRGQDRPCFVYNAPILTHRSHEATPAARITT